jgi:hypothetical protein
MSVCRRSCPSPASPGSPGWAPARRWECRRLNLGHFAAGRWQLTSPDQPTDRPDVLISARASNAAPVDVLDTLLHEAAHGLAYARQVQDTSRQGRYQPPLRAAGPGARLGRHPPESHRLAGHHRP